MIEKDLDFKLYNCGGFALDLPEIITPWKDGENVGYFEQYDYRQNLLVNLGEIYDDINEIYRHILIHDKAFLLKTYPQLKEISSKEILKYKKVVAYRLFITYTNDGIYLDSDFHFRVCVNGFWFEKCGQLPPRLCENYNEEPWVCCDIEEDDGLIYDSPIIYFSLEK